MMTNFCYIEFSPLTFEKMEKWAINSDTRFSDQDEDLLLAANIENLPLLFTFLRQDGTLSAKKDEILSAVGGILNDSLINRGINSTPLDKVIIDEVLLSLRDSRDTVLQRVTDADNEIPLGHLVILYWAIQEPLPEALATDEQLLERYYNAAERVYQWLIG